MKVIVAFSAFFAIAACQTDFGCVNEGYPVCQTGPFDIDTSLVSPLGYLNVDYEESSCGPQPVLEPVRPLSPIFLPPVDGPVVALPCPVLPPPTVIFNKCSCTKTVMKPQLYQRIIQVQKNQRFLKKTYRPVLEKIPYCAKPSC